MKFSDIISRAFLRQRIAAALLCESASSWTPIHSIDTMLAGDVETGKAILRDYIKATVGFEKLGEAIGTQPKSLIRMFGPRGNPQARNLFGIIGYLQKQAGVEFHVSQRPL
jgi:hypothetical protein